MRVWPSRWGESPYKRRHKRACFYPLLPPREYMVRSQEESSGGIDQQPDLGLPSLQNTEKQISSVSVPSPWCVCDGSLS